MKIPLDHIPSERHQDFLDYLSAEFRCLGTHNSHMILIDGSRQIDVVAKFSTETGPIELQWRISSHANGELSHITVEALDQKISEDKWRAIAHKFYEVALANFNDRNCSKYFFESFFYYIGPQLDGEYWFPGYRFAPAYPDDSDPLCPVFERIVRIDQEVEAVDWVHALVLGGVRSRRLAARLSLLLNTALYGENRQRIHRWVFPWDMNTRPPEKSERYESGFRHPSLHLHKMPEKRQLCPLGKYQGTLVERYGVGHELLSLPPEAERILLNIDANDSKIRDAFDYCARLCQVGAMFRDVFPSVELAYRVAAIDAVRQTTAGRQVKDRRPILEYLFKILNCERKNGRVSNKGQNIRQFMKLHLPSRPDLKKDLEHLLNYGRHAHFHAGKFSMGEYDRDWTYGPLLASDEFENATLDQGKYRALAREAIVNWLSKHVPGSAA